MTISIHELARLTNLSIATVSRVFNQRDGVRPKTRERVLAAAAKHGYVPQQSARSRLVGVLVESREGLDLYAYGSMLLEAISREARKRGFQLRLILPEDLETGAAPLGLHQIICMAYSQEQINQLSGTTAKVVCINTRHAEFHSVCSDEEQGIALAIDHLFVHGHSRIGLLLASGDNECAQRRHKAFADTMKIKGHHADDLMQLVSGECAMQAIAKLLRQGVTGIIACGEGLGLAASYALNMLGKEVPADISLIGHDYRGVSRYLWPAQTTMAQDFEAMAEACFKLIQDSPDKPCQLTIPYQFIKRDSVARLASNERT